MVTMPPVGTFELYVKRGHQITHLALCTIAVTTQNTETVLAVETIAHLAALNYSNLLSYGFSYSGYGHLKRISVKLHWEG